jgi:hypothetical protein
MLESDDEAGSIENFAMDAMMPLNNAYGGFKGGGDPFNNAYTEQLVDNYARQVFTQENFS